MTQDEEVTYGRLLEELKADHPAAFTRFYELLGGEVNRLVWRLLGSDAEHDDVVQRVFVAAARTVHTVREAGALKGWIRAVTTNVVRNELRQRTKRRRLFASVASHAPPAEHPPAVEQRDELRRALALVAALPVDERMAFVLRNVDELPLDEAAAAVGTSLATFKRRLAKAEDRFMRQVERDPGLCELLVELKRGGER